MKNFHQENIFQKRSGGKINFFPRSASLRPPPLISFSFGKPCIEGYLRIHLRVVSTQKNQIEIRKNEMLHFW